MDHSKGKNKSPETKPKEMQTLNLLNKDFKTIFLFFFFKYAQWDEGGHSQTPKQIHEKMHEVRLSMKRSKLYLIK